MKLILNGKEFKSALKDVSGAMRKMKKTTPPIFGSVRIKANSQGVAIISNSLDAAIERRMDVVQCDTSIDACVEFKSLQKLASSVKGQISLKLNLKEDSPFTVTVDNGVFAMDVPAYSSNDFPEIVELGNENWKPVSTRTVSEMMKAFGFVSDDKAHIALQGIVFPGDGGLMGSDGKWLYVYETMELAGIRDDGVLIKGEYAKCIEALADKSNVQFRFEQDEHKCNCRCEFKADGIRMIFKLYDGISPNFRQVIPGHLKHGFKYPKAVMDAVRQAYKVTKDKVGFQIIPEAISRDAWRLNFALNERTVGEAVIEGDQGWRYKTSLALDMLAHVFEMGYDRMWFNDSQSPVVFKGEDTQIVMMPLRVTKDALPAPEWREPEGVQEEPKAEIVQQAVAQIEPVAEPVQEVKVEAVPEVKAEPEPVKVEDKGTVEPWGPSIVLPDVKPIIEEEVKEEVKQEVREPFKAHESKPAMCFGPSAEMTDEAVGWVEVKA